MAAADRPFHREHSTRCADAGIEQGDALALKAALDRLHKAGFASPKRPGEDGAIAIQEVHDHGDLRIPSISPLRDVLGRTRRSFHARQMLFRVLGCSRSGCKRQRQAATPRLVTRSRSWGS